VSGLIAFYLRLAAGLHAAVCMPRFLSCAFHPALFILRYARCDFFTTF
jgi:hypothetical protein